MTREILTVCSLLFFTGRAFSQYPTTMYVGSNTPGVPYEKTQQEMVNNFLYNKPLLNYIPVYNTAYGQWNGETGKQDKLSHDVKTSQVSYQHVAPPNFDTDLDMQKLGQILNGLKLDMHVLGQKAKEAFENKLKEFNQVKKLNEDVKCPLQKAEAVRNTLCEQEKQLGDLRKSVQGRTDWAVANPTAVQDFLKMIENLELMVRNIGSKYGGKSGM